MHCRDRADVALEQVVQERLHLVAAADEVNARQGHGVGRRVADGGAFKSVGDLAGQRLQPPVHVLPLEGAGPLVPERVPLDVLPPPQVLDPLPDQLLHRVGLEGRVPDDVDRRDPFARQRVGQLGLDVDLPLPAAEVAHEVVGREHGHHHLRLPQAGEDPRLPGVHRPDVVGIEEHPQRRARDPLVVGLDRGDQRRHLARVLAAVVGVGVADEQVELVPFRGFHHGASRDSLTNRLLQSLHRCTNRLAVAGLACLDLSLGKPAVRWIGFHSGVDPRVQFHIEQLHDIARWGLGALRKISEFDMYGGRGRNTVVRSLAKIELLGDLAHQAFPKTLIGLSMSRDKVKPPPTRIPLCQPESLAIPHEADHGHGGLGLSHEFAPAG